MRQPRCNKNVAYHSEGEKMIKCKIRAVIFDLDGTLVDSEPNYYEADKKMLSQYGITDFDLAAKKKYVGIGAKEMMEDIKRQYHIPDSVETLVTLKNKYYLELARANTPVFTEMKMLLELLEKEQYPLALASGSSPQVIDIVLGGAELRKYFKVVISAEEVDRGKPAPDIFLEAARQLSIASEHCLVVEDSRYGVEAAKNAGMSCIAIPYPDEKTLHSSYLNADLLLKNGMEEFSAEKTFNWIKTFS
ncbi:MAG: HAD-superfamily hydrolase, subfamily variant 3 [Firmicutes bacterium]|nr:HAD-superfamily hydrolase, subfamily variant 3 [Bacillota bacterium]